jgi:hypothetical protein
MIPRVQKRLDFGENAHLSLTNANAKDRAAQQAPISCQGYLDLKA